MTTRSPRPTSLVALAGAVAVAVSLWLPWYAIDLSKAVDSALGGASGAAPAGPMGELAKGILTGLLQAVPQQMMSATGWIALEGADVALAMIAAAVAVLALVGGLPAAVRGRLVALAGAGAAGIAAVHLVDRPGPDGLVVLKPGVWVALAGGLAIAVAGVFGSSEPAQARPTATPAAPPVATAAGTLASVPPPGWPQAPQA
jgi:hypothetical protein